jgi:hypothetical protein
VLLKPSGGIILWHDYLLTSCPEVYRFLNDLSRDHELYLIAGTKMVLYSSDPAVNPIVGLCG